MRVGRSRESTFGARETEDVGLDRSEVAGKEMVRGGKASTLFFGTAFRAITAPDGLPRWRRDLYLAACVSGNNPAIAASRRRRFLKVIVYFSVIEWSRSYRVCPVMFYCSTESREAYQDHDVANARAPKKSQHTYRRGII